LVAQCVTQIDPSRSISLNLLNEKAPDFFKTFSVPRTDKSCNPFGFLLYLTIQNKYVMEIKMQIEKLIKKFYLCVRNY
jgi:hypothetical protein